MCGLFGVLGASSRERLEAGTRALAHRGPDGDGLWESPDGLVGLGHRRLAVVDAAGGTQPLVSARGDVVAVVNGALAGFVEQRRALEAAGRRFRTGSDGELVLHLYERHGPDLVEHLRGEFAFLLWDGRARRLVAARDRFGAKPLVWALGPDGELLLASEARALFAAGVLARWDRRALHGAASFHYVPPGRTLFEGVHALRPGHLLTAEPGRAPVVRRWWDDAAPVAVREEASLADEAAALRDHLDRAVRRRVEADGPIGCLLSGGLDSSAVLALAAARVSKAFFVSFPGAGQADEGAEAARVAAHAGVEAVAVELTPDDLLGHLPEAVVAGEVLVANGHAPARWCLARAVRSAGVKVVVTGEGADEVLAGYPHLHDLAPRAGTADGASSGLMLPLGDGLPVGAAAVGGVVPGFVRAKATLGRRVHQLLAADWLAEHADRDPLADLVASAGPVPGTLPPLRRALTLWTRLALAQYILRAVGDGPDMAHGLEARLPFLDADLATWARGLAPRHLARTRLAKRTLRAAVADVLPAATRARPKQPFLAPPLTGPATRGRVRTLLGDLLTGPGAPPFLDAPAAVAALDRLETLPPAEQRAWDPAITLALSAAVLHRRLGLSA